MVPNVCKNLFSRSKSRKKCIYAINISFTGFHELTPKPLGIIAGLILHCCGV